MTRPPEDIKVALANAFADIVQQQEHGFVTKWIAIIESVDESGSSGLWTCASDSIAPWEALGLLLYTLVMEVGRTLHITDERPDEPPGEQSDEPLSEQ